MKNNAREITIRTWYGFDAKACIEQGQWHSAGFGRFRIPHPPVANWLLRQGLSAPAYRHLCVWHEIGHLQLLPFEILYAIILFSVSYINANTGFFQIIQILLSCFAFWEIMAESYVITRKASCYKLHYKGISILPRVIFWSLTVLLMLAGWVVALA